ncbi:MAG TPA: helix-turn-helix domain-containing protein [Polyangiaceae bacterium]|nr:helix-turn-helix domain-containing protein [Polyangiaceae bacterium]
MAKRRNYKQFCGLARALDHVGERWTLLVVRNLLLGPKRYSDLLEELPGLTTNLLAERLREMEHAGLVHKRKAPAPVRATVYELTPMGRALEPTVMELARWGARFMDRPRKTDTFNVGWALLSLKRRYRGGLAAIVSLRVGEREFELAFTPSYLAVTEGRAARPDLGVAGSEQSVLAWLFRGADPSALRERGELRVTGSETAWEGLRAAFVAQEPDAEDIAGRLASRGVLEPLA